MDMFILKTKVVDLVLDGEWRWLGDWNFRFKELLDIPAPSLIDNHKDRVCNIAKRLWERLKGMAKLEHVSNSRAQVISSIVNILAKNSIWSVIQRIISLKLKVTPDVIMASKVLMNVQLEETHKVKTTELNADTGVLTRTGLVNPVRPNEKRAVQTINTARPVSTARSISTARPFAPKTAQTSSVVRLFTQRMDNVKTRAYLQSNQGGSSRKGYSKPTKGVYITDSITIMLRPRIPIEDVIQDAQEKSFENAPNDKCELDSEDIAAKQALKDDLERMVDQEMAAQAVDDAIRQAFEVEKRKSASTKRAAQATSINKLNTRRPSVNTANIPYVSAASTPIGANAGESSFVYLGG
ncbi:hypothetical protein Tco_1468580 [Tanacetum coccineum]